MLWLILQMGSLLGAAALFGTLIGWGIRGIMLKGRARRAIVERDIALTELDQKQMELDGLYAAQKSGVAAAAEAGDSTLKRELQAREEKVHSLTSALASSQEELEKLKERGAAGALGTGAAASTQQVAQSSATTSDERLDTPVHQPSADLEWRNRYLESRVRTLEGKMDTLGADLATAEQAAAAAAAEVTELAKAAEAQPAVSVPTPISPPPAEAVAVDAVSADTAKLTWLNSYLNTRLAYLAANPIQDRAGLYDNGVEVSAADEPNGVDPEPNVPSEPAASTDNGKAAGELEQELARLRWRNRYLEGRLAYIEGDVERSEDAVSAAPSQDADLTSGKVSTAVPRAAAKPPTLERPEDDGDDLTQIRGITPDVKAALNEIGVWRFTQIASWSKENIAWIAEHVAGKGAANHQDWVGQADVLAKGGGSA